MTDRYKHLYAEFGGSPIYDEDSGGLTKAHPDYGSKAAEVGHHTIIGKLATRCNIWEKYAKEQVAEAILEYAKLTKEQQKGLTLYEWLGLDEYEYKAYVENRATIESFIKERRSRISPSGRC